MMLCKHKMHKKNPQYAEHNKSTKHHDFAQKKSLIHVTFPMSSHFFCNNFHAFILEENHEAKVTISLKCPVNKAKSLF